MSSEVLFEADEELLFTTDSFEELRQAEINNGGAAKTQQQGEEEDFGNMDLDDSQVDFPDL